MVSLNAVRHAAISLQIYCVTSVGVRANTLSQKQKQLKLRGVFRKVTPFVLKTSIYSKLREYKALFL